MVERYQQGTGIDLAQLRDEVILFHASTNKFCVLNRTSTFMWSALKQPSTGDEIVERLGGNFEGVDLEQVRSDVDLTLKEMLALGLIVQVDTTVNLPPEVKA